MAKVVEVIIGEHVMALRLDDGRILTIGQREWREILKLALPGKNINEWLDGEGKNIPRKYLSKRS